jgi:hypothetical protein
VADGRERRVEACRAVLVVVTDDTEVAGNLLSGLLVGADEAERDLIAGAEDSGGWCVSQCPPGNEPGLSGPITGDHSNRFDSRFGADVTKSLLSLSSMRKSWWACDVCELPMTQCEQVSGRLDAAVIRIQADRRKCRRVVRSEHHGHFRVVCTEALEAR